MGNTNTKQTLSQSPEELQARIVELEEQVEASQEEKRILLQEIHHRVKNNLQIISSILILNSASASDPQVLDILKDTISRVDTISLIHKNLYESSNLAEIDMQSYLRQQIDNLFHHYPIRTKHITLDMQSEAVSLQVDKALHCALLTNELVVNAFRHGFPEKQPGTLFIRLLASDKNRMQLHIGDDGIGLPEEIELSQVQSTGLRLVHNLTRQLKAKLSLKRNSGTYYELDIPITN